jgi:uncharacterized membrane protein YedE/YeeE
MTREHRRGGLVALVAGALFGAGLLLSGMTRPERVLAFLDLFGAWDPTLAFVMIGAIGVHAVARLWIVQRSGDPAPESPVAPPAALDRKLIAGAAVFGVGWGLAGYCPGPSVVSLASGAGGAWLFVASMVAGMLVASRFQSPAPIQASTSAAGVATAPCTAGNGLPRARRRPS